MSLRGDDRAQSVQVGAVILFGFVVVAMAGYQASVVPAENGAAEFRHSEAVQEEMGDLRNALLGAGVGGDAAPRSVRLGLRYPDRTFFVNPPPVTGELRTGPARTLWLNGTDLGDPDANDGWSGNESFATRSLVHAADYHVNGREPRNRIEHGLLYTAYADATVTRTEQPVVSGNRITLVTVDGSLSRSGTGSATVDPERLSVSTTETTLEAGADPELFLPAANASVWERAIETDPATDDSYVANVSAVPGGVVVALRPNETYRLRLAQVGVGSGTGDPDAEYVTPESGRNATVPENNTHRVTVSVRDRFTNPVAGAAVNATLVGAAGGSISTGPDPANRTGLRTDADGEVSITYHAPAGVTGVAAARARIRVGVEDGPAALRGAGYDPRGPLNATVTVNVANSDGSGTGSDPGSGINPNAPGAVILQQATISQCNSEPCRVDVSFRNTDENATRRFSEARFNFYSVDRQSGGGGSQRAPPELVEFSNTTGGGVQQLPSASSGGEFRPVNVSIGPEDTASVPLEFYETTAGASEFEVVPGDFFVMSVIFDDGRSAMYFVGPVADSANQAPTADLSTSITGLTADFTDQSTDPDGSIASRS